VISSGNPEYLVLQFASLWTYFRMYFRSNSPRSAEQLGRLWCAGEKEERTCDGRSADLDPMDLVSSEGDLVLLV